MFNYSNNQEIIEKHYKSGLISTPDYKLYQQIIGKSNTLKKGLESGALTNSIYSESVKPLQYTFDRQINNGLLQYKLITNAVYVPPVEQPIRKSSDGVKNIDSIQKSGLSKAINPIQKTLDAIDKASEEIHAMAQKIRKKPGR
jgi:hypothetical protein